MSRTSAGRSILLALLVWGALHAGQAQAALVDASDPTQEILLQAMESLHSGRHDEARRLLSRYSEQIPDDPLVPLLRLKVIWWEILEGRDPEGRLDPQFDSEFERVRTLAEARLGADDRDVRSLYALGEAWCTSGRLEGLRGHGWSTLRQHQKGTPYLERALELDPTLAEPLVSLGVFHYYASRAPAFLRFMARVLRVKADRPLGLRFLRDAASVPGIQQAEAAFFLLEILTNVEDDYVEALPLALQFHARYPDNLGFRIPLTTVQLAWGRADAAVALLRAAGQGTPEHERIASRFFEARVLGMTGRAHESATLLEAIPEADVQRVSWLPAWHPYYLGAAYDQLGRTQDAAVAYRHTVDAPRVADSHGFAKRALERDPSDLDRVLSRARRALCWRDSVDVCTEALRIEIERGHHAEAETRAEAAYLLGCLEIERGEVEAAVDALRRAVEVEPEEEAWLVTRPRVRLLQALLWAGRFDEAMSWAEEFSERNGEWGSNQHLQLLVRTALHPEVHDVTFAPTLIGHESSVRETFRLRDIGFTSVHLVTTHASRLRRIPMRMRDGFWEASVPMDAGRHLYRFEIESTLRVPDPGSSDVALWQGELWSAILVSSDDAASSSGTSGAALLPPDSGF